MYVYIYIHIFIYVYVYICMYVCMENVELCTLGHMQWQGREAQQQFFALTSKRPLAISEEAWLQP